jgi:FkbM family methyltransferase
MLRINHNPRLTIEVARRRLLASGPLVVVDVGARGGPSPVWLHFEPDLRIVAFEADLDEATRLGLTPVALGARRECRTFLRTRFVGADGFYPFGELLAGTVGDDAHFVVNTEEVETIPLDEILAEPVDVLKLDVQGAELDVLQGASNALASALCVEVEVHFPSRPAGSASFAEVDALLRSTGFDLYDLETYRYARRVFPAPPLYDYRDDAGNPVWGPTVEGQVLTGDALYFRRDEARRLKLACLFELHRLPDCACEALLETPHPDLINFLTPLVDDRYPTYAEYLDHARTFVSSEHRIYGPNYHLLVDLWATSRPDS